MPNTTPQPRRRVRRLTRFLCDEVSICKTPINELARIVILKSGDRAVSKLPEAEVDEDRQFVAGWASVVSVDGKPVIDTEGDTMTEADLVESAEEFMRSYRRGKKSHQGDADKVEFVQSVVFTEEVQDAMGIDLGFVGWWLGGYVRDDELWQDVRAGTFRGFSVGGSAVRLVVEGEVEKSRPKRGTSMTLAEALARTPPPAPHLIAKAFSRAAASPARKAASVPVQQQATTPKVAMPTAPRASTVALDALRRAIVRDTASRDRQSVAEVSTAPPVAMPRSAVDFAKNAIHRDWLAERDGKKSAPSGNRALEAGRAALKRLTTGQ